MKKLIALLLALMLLPCFALAETPSAAGTWYLWHMTNDDGTMLAALSGAGMTLTLNEDGSAKSISTAADNVTTLEGTWSQNGDALSITLGGKERTGSFDGTTLTLNGATTLSFGDHAVVTSRYAAAPSDLDATAEDFEGLWVCRYVMYNGQLVSVSALGATMKVHVIGDNAIVNIGTTGEEEQIQQYPYTIENGLMHIGNEEITIMTLQMLEDGVAAYVKSDLNMIYYFEDASLFSDY